MPQPTPPTPAIPPALLCLCTCPDAACGERIAQALLEERLAACVSLLPGLQSVYRWQGALERASEVLLLIKTTPARYPALETRLRALHPYELPELLAFESSTGLPAYLRWLAAETGPQDPAA
ncbi:divalent-cation tolerance protein CutA [Thermomonas flagellata]|uniref:divalent-cation tolerance protein CutA n=1 Tax=Thermomonas flagellata TaxID=2888524 RepID=UPI001F04C337|nr:divalent-cation tolerance protein CutA [Thermomonas flagellata]